MTRIEENAVRPDAGLDGFPGPVLVLAPHMDDETLACGRLLAALSDDAVPVHVVFATDGARSPAVTPDRVTDLVNTRAAEARCALDALGVEATNAHFLALPDGSLRSHMTALTLGIGRLWASLRPATVLVPSRFDRHPDHLAVRRAAAACARRAPGTATLWEYFVYYRWRLLPGGDLRAYLREDRRFAPDTSAYVDAKERALACYVTQTTRYAQGQRRAILPPRRVAEVSRSEEVFVRFEPGDDGVAVLARGRAWVPIAHRLEPALKAAKERAAEWRSDPARRSGSAPSAATSGPAQVQPGTRPAAGPSRVIVFASPYPLPAERAFLARVDAHPDLELVAVLCRGEGVSTIGRLRDLWRRRGPLAIPLAALGMARDARRRDAPPRDAVRRIASRRRVVPDVHASEILHWVASLDLDVGVVYGGPILKSELFELPRRGTLGVHHGRLPDYRGKKTVFWAMANGEEQAGVTIQEINAGLDTGRPVREGGVAIGRRGYGEVSRRVQALGVHLLFDALLAGEPAASRSSGPSPRPESAPPERPTLPESPAESQALARRPPLYRDPSLADLIRVTLRRFLRR